MTTMPCHEIVRYPNRSLQNHLSLHLLDHFLDKQKQPIKTRGQPCSSTRHLPSKPEGDQLVCSQKKTCDDTPTHWGVQTKRFKCNARTRGASVRLVSLAGLILFKTIDWIKAEPLPGWNSLHGNGIRRHAARTHRHMMSCETIAVSKQMKEEKSKQSSQQRPQGMEKPKVLNKAISRQLLKRRKKKVLD